jgi:hypothetical protein
MNNLAVLMWRSPSGRLHRNRMCSDGGRPRTRMEHVALDSGNFDAARETGEVCRCIASDPFATIRVPA